MGVGVGVRVAMREGVAVGVGVGVHPQGQVTPAPAGVSEGLPAPFIEMIERLRLPVDAERRRWRCEGAPVAHSLRETHLVERPAQKGIAVEPAHPQLRCRSWRSDLCGLARLPVDEHLRRSGGTATCKTVARRDCAPHTVMRTGRPRTRHTHGSIMLHFARVRMSLSPRASRLAPHPLAPHPSPRPPPPVRPQRCCAPPRCRPTFNVQRSTFNPSRLIPSPRPPPPVRPQRCCAPPRCRPTFNVQRQPSTPRASSPRHGPRCRYGRSAAAPLRRPAALSPLTSCPSHLLPLAPLASCLSPLDGAMQRCYGRRSTFQPSTPRASSPLASCLARDRATKPSTDRKPVSPRIAIRRQPMLPGCRGSPAPVPRDPTLVPGSAVPFPTRQRAAASARVTP